MAASRSPHRLAHSGVGGSQFARIRGGWRGGVALGSSVDSSATVVERPCSWCDRDYRTGGDRRNAGVRRRME